jgi:hypothetical protein
MPPRPSRNQMDLLEWQPPQPERFDEPKVRAASVGARISRAVAAALADCDLSREEIAQQLGAYLGEAVSPNVLNAYASQAREGHKIAACRLLALVHVTGDRRLLELLAEPFGWTVIERRFLKMIELAAVREQEDELRRQRLALSRQVKSGGML